MQEKLAETLVQIMQDAGEDAEIYENYSGRAMYGKTTTGIVVDNLALVLTHVIANAGQFCTHDYDGDIEAEFDIDTLKYDNMGNQIILY